MNVQVTLGINPNSHESIDCEALFPDHSKVYGSFSLNHTVIKVDSNSRYAGQTNQAKTKEMFKRLIAAGHTTAQELNKLLAGEVVKLELPLDMVRIGEENDDRNPGVMRTRVQWLGGYEIRGAKVKPELAGFSFE